MRVKVFLIVVVVLSLARVATAQTGVPVSYLVEVVAAGSATPLTAVAVGTTTIPYSVGICNQALFPTVPPAVETAPSRFTWSDPVNANRLCVSAPQTTFLATLPKAGTATVAGYVYRLSATNADGTVASTTVSNGFSLLVPPNPPAVPTGLQVRP